MELLKPSGGRRKMEGVGTETGRGTFSRTWVTVKVKEVDKGNTGNFTGDPWSTRVSLRRNVEGGRKSFPM